MKISISKWVMISFAVLVLMYPMIVEAVPVVFSVGGDNTPASIQTTVTNFQNTLGNPNNGNAPGPLNSGRREINWDGGGATTPTVTGTPLTAFQNIRGALINTPTGTGFIQAAPSDLATQFSNATYSTIFNIFSPLRLFTPIGSNTTDVTFFIPGTNGLTPATVTGFGAVFADVDLVGSTKIDFFDISGSLLTSQNVTPGTVANGSLSFLGVAFNAGERIGRVRLTTGNAAPGPNDGAGIDVVVLDDLLFAEPRAIPEASALLLLGLGVAVVGLAALRRRR
jgi:hypothetical protein